MAHTPSPTPSTATNARGSRWAVGAGIATTSVVTDAADVGEDWIDGETVGGAGAEAGLKWRYAGYGS